MPSPTIEFKLNDDDRYPVFDFVQREPLLTWKPKDPASHPVDYFVPNFGVDHDIEHSQAHEKAVSTQLSHTWTPTKDKDDKWVVPTTTAEFKLNDNERLLWDFIKLDEEMN